MSQWAAFGGGSRREEGRKAQGGPGGEGNGAGEDSVRGGLHADAGSVAFVLPAWPPQAAVGDGMALILTRVFLPNTLGVYPPAAAVTKPVMPTTNTGHRDS